MTRSRPRPRRLAAAALGLALAVGVVAGAPRAAGAAPLTVDETAQLERGETVVRPQTLEVENRRYVGGVTYTLIEATPERLLALLDDEAAYLEVLPRTKQAERVAGDASNVWMLLHQGNALVDASYTMHVTKEPLASRVRFWVDLTRPHDIEDAWGFFRWQPARPGVLLVTFGTLFDLGVGVLRSVYEERLRKVILEVPQRLRRYVAKTDSQAPWASGS